LKNGVVFQVSLQRNRLKRNCVKKRTACIEKI